jgi:hypothetical protein
MYARARDLHVSLLVESKVPQLNIFSDVTL